MPTAFINRAKIYYEIIGHSGPCVAAIPGGRHAHSEIEELTRAMASRGYRVIVHDFRNCSQSSLDFNTLEPGDDGARVAYPLCAQSSRRDTRPRAVGTWRRPPRRQVP
jgi:hypothetical protein